MWEDIVKEKLNLKVTSITETEHIGISGIFLRLWAEIHLPQLGTKYLCLLVFDSWTLFTAILNLVG